MSVLACDRKDCERIMCDILVWELNVYICHDCISEFIETHKHLQFSSNDEIVEALKVFMKSAHVDRDTHDSEEILRNFFYNERQET